MWYRCYFYADGKDFYNDLEDPDFAGLRAGDSYQYGYALAGTPYTAQEIYDLFVSHFSGTTAAAIAACEPSSMVRSVETMILNANYRDLFPQNEEGLDVDLLRTAQLIHSVAVEKVHGSMTTFTVGQTVQPSGWGRTSTWPKISGTVTRISIPFYVGHKTQVFVHWNGTSFEDEMEPQELVEVNPK